MLEQVYNVRVYRKADHRAADFLVYGTSPAHARERFIAWMPKQPFCDVYDDVQCRDIELRHVIKDG